MKAYVLYDAYDQEHGWDVVFAETAKQAKKKTGYTPIDVDQYIDLRVKRYPAFDGMQDANELQLAEAKWREGWWFNDMASIPPEPETSTTKEFIAWYTSK